jgi:hypothetical protein
VIQRKVEQRRERRDIGYQIEHNNLFSWRTVIPLKNLHMPYHLSLRLHWQLNFAMNVSVGKSHPNHNTAVVNDAKETKRKEGLDIQLVRRDLVIVQATKRIFVL